MRGTRQNRIAVVATLVVLFVGGWAAMRAEAQQYPPPTPTQPPPTPRPTRTPRPTARPTATPRPTRSPRPTPPGQSGDHPNPRCLAVSGETDDGFVANEVEYQGDLVLEGRSGCAAPRGDVTFTVQSDPVTLGTVKAYEDGSFKVTYVMPASILPGEHTVIADVADRGQIRQPLVVTGAVVGGVSETNDGNGLLPRTGGGIALLVLWGLILVGGGTLLVLAARRRFGARGAWAGPEAHVPLVDTSRFVPYRSRTAPSREPERGNLTEWDVYGSETPKS